MLAHHQEPTRALEDTSSYGVELWFVYLAQERHHEEGDSWVLRITENDQDGYEVMAWVQAQLLEDEMDFTSFARDLFDKDASAVRNHPRIHDMCDGDGDPVLCRSTQLLAELASWQVDANRRRGAQCTFPLVSPARRYRRGSASSKTGRRTGQRTRQNHAYNVW